MSDHQPDEIEEALLLALEPFAEALAETRKALDDLQREPGQSGAPGLGIDAPPFDPGKVWREGSVVTHFIGQHFKALRDTVSEPGVSDHWGRIGSGGFRMTGAFDEGREYQDGDLFVKDFGCFLVTAGAPKLIAGRGARGAPGEPGRPGVPGAPGARITAAECKGFKAVIIQEVSGETEQITLDFEPAFDAHFQRIKGTMTKLETRLTELETLFNQLSALQKTSRKMN